MMELRGEVTGTEVVTRRLGYAHLLGAPSRHFARVSGEITRDLARDEAPEGVTKKLKESIDFAVDPSTPSLWMRVFANLDYAAPVEKGSRPHMPPVAAITPWALAKGINPWALARSIARRGTRANPFMERAFARAPRGVRGLLAVLARDIERAGSSG